MVSIDWKGVFMAIEIGQVGMATVVVEANNTAEYMGSGGIDGKSSLYWDSR